ncbi:Smr/MutS family protein [Rickettsiales bacterium]|nr:Smr/MutS family protein [Rickettsiales bacterium]
MAIKSDKDWEDYIKTVKPLKKSRVSTSSSLTEKLHLEIEKEDNDDLVSIDILSETKINNSIIDRNLLKSIKKGKMKVNAVLDLHGKKVKESKVSVYNFIKYNYEKSNRLLLIITGKGKRLGVEEGWKGKGVLKSMLPNWLNSIALSKYIVWFDNAPKDQGGDGALIIYIKKL